MKWLYEDDNHWFEELWVEIFFFVIFFVFQILYIFTCYIKIFKKINFNGENMSTIEVKPFCISIP